MEQLEKVHTCSAILVNYNHSAYLNDALDVALNQTVSFDEIIIIDDASTDNSVDIINQRIAGIPHARLIQNEKNIGVIASVNKVTLLATGDFVYFMSADDRYSTHIMEWYRDIIATYPDISMISGNASVYNAQTGIERQFPLAFPQKNARYTAQDIDAIAKKHIFTFRGGANIIRREAILQAGGQLPALKWHGDWFLYLLIACRYPFVVIPKNFIRIHQTPDQYSSACFMWEKQRLVIKYFIHILQQNYPREYHFFRNNAMLPTYDTQALFLLLRDKTLRYYLTPLLVWRLLTYKSLRMVGRLLPDTLRARIRRWVRV